MKNELAKKQVIETITDILIDVVGWIERDEISPDKDFVEEMRIVDDDLDAFGMEVLKHFGIRLKFGEYYPVRSIDEFADLVLELLKDLVTETTIAILIDIVGWIERDEILPNKNFVQEMHIAGDDLTIFAMEVVKRFGIKPTQAEWYQTGTIEGVADLVIEHLLKSGDPIKDPKWSIPADSSLGKRPLISPAFTEWLARLLALFISWVVGLGILEVLLAYTDWPFILIITPVVLWIFVTSWLIFKPRS